ncbi:MAG TPA: heme biosynthesis HemY N-terminal domain-containing protein [Burkholderiaceae bacterium]|nr:heme biosynthesis HemY N-terminal domain-containing protein [Burkholderiaceae bacterium]
MRWIAWLLLAFGAAVAVAILARFNYGNVAILWPPYRIELSANLALALLLLGFVVLYLLLRGAARTLALPQRVREYRERRAQERAALALRDTVLGLLEGRLARVDKAAQLAQSNPATAAPAALIAARASHRLQQWSRRDQWLADAARDDAASAALLTTKAEMAIEQQQPQAAIEIVERLHSRGARHIVTMRLALAAYEQAGDWERMLHTLRLIAGRDAMPAPALRQLRVTAASQLLRARAGDAAAVRAAWRSFKRDEQALPEVAALAATLLIDAGASDEARRIVEVALDADYSDAAIVVYARMEQVPVRERLARIEAWRMRYGDPPRLLLELGRLCVAERLWGKAEEYLKSATAREPTVAAHLALGELYELLERPADASRQYRQAGELALALPAPAAIASARAPWALRPEGGELALDARAVAAAAPLPVPAAATAPRLPSDVQDESPKTAASPADSTAESAAPRIAGPPRG